MCEADPHMLAQFILLTLLKVGREALAAELWIQPRAVITIIIQINHAAKSEQNQVTSLLSIL